MLIGKVYIDNTIIMSYIKNTGPWISFFLAERTENYQNRYFPYINKICLLHSDVYHYEINGTPGHAGKITFFPLLYYLLPLGVRTFKFSSMVEKKIVAQLYK